MSQSRLDFIRLDTGFFGSTQVKRWERMYGFDGVLGLIRLFCYAGHFHPDGDLMILNHEDFAEVMQWEESWAEGESSVKLLEDLVSFGWLSEDHRIEDWAEQQGLVTDEPAPKPKKRKVPKASDSAVDLAEELQALIKEHTPLFTVTAATLQGWAIDLDRAMRIDGKTGPQLVEAMRFAHVEAGGAFWRPNILSGRKLREKCDQLLMQKHQRQASAKAETHDDLHAKLKEEEAAQ